jgi:membrane protein YdbS with pleckstrin-like domain
MSLTSSISLAFLGFAVVQVLGFISASFPYFAEGARTLLTLIILLIFAGLMSYWAALSAQGKPPDIAFNHGFLMPAFILIPVVIFAVVAGGLL